MTEPDLTLHGALELSEKFPSKIGICVLSVTGANISNGHLVSTQGSLRKLWFKKSAKCITLSGMKITANEAIMVRRIVANVGMRTLTLQSCTIDVNCMKSILEAATTNYIQYLDMTGTKVGMDVAKVLENYIKNRSPKKLILRSCSVTSGECKIILRGFKRISEIEAIDLRENQLDESAVKSILEVMENTTIHLLRLGQCGLSEDDKLTLERGKPRAARLDFGEVISHRADSMVAQSESPVRQTDVLDMESTDIVHRRAQNVDGMVRQPIAAQVEPRERQLYARRHYNISLYRKKNSNIVVLIIEHGRKSDELYPEYALYETTMNRTPAKLGGHCEIMILNDGNDARVHPLSYSFSETELWKEKCIIEQFRITADTDGITHHEIVLKQNCGETVVKLFDLEWPWPVVPKESGDIASVMAKGGGIVVTCNRNCNSDVFVSEDNSEGYDSLSDSGVGETESV